MLRDDGTVDTDAVRSWVAESSKQFAQDAAVLQNHIKGLESQVVGLRALARDLAELGPFVVDGECGLCSMDSDYPNFEIASAHDVSCAWRRAKEMQSPPMG